MNLTDCYAKFGVNVQNPRNPPWSARADDGTVVVTLFTTLFCDTTRNEYSNFNLPLEREWIDKPKNRERIKHLRYAKENHDGIFQSIIVVSKDSSLTEIVSDRCEIGPRMRLIELNEDGEFRAVSASASA